MAEAKKKVIAHRRALRNVVQRNLTLLEQVMQYLLAEPTVFSALPNNFELVILPEDDPEIRLYNLKLLDGYGQEGKPVVLAQIKSTRHSKMKPTRPLLYVPLAA